MTDTITLWLEQLDRQLRELLNAPDYLMQVAEPALAAEYFHNGYSVEDALPEIARQVRAQHQCVFEKFRITPPDPQPTPESGWIISGAVDSVDFDAGLVTLWLNSWDHFETVPIDPRMPGWMLAPEMAFRTTIPRRLDGFKTTLDGVVWGEFYTMPFSCKTEWELFESIGAMLRDG